VTAPPDDDLAVLAAVQGVLIEVLEARNGELAGPEGPGAAEAGQDEQTAGEAAPLAAYGCDYHVEWRDAGGAISLVISRQQLKAAHAQRAEDAEEDKHRRSIERRFTAYADLLDKARSFRNALRPYGYQPVPLLAPKEISALARSAHAASPLAFLVVESRRTRVALGELVKAMSDIQGVLDDDASDPTDKPWPDFNERIKFALDKFEDAARQELEVRTTP
jgi:hypothetical protein